MRKVNQRVAQLIRAKKTGKASANTEVVWSHAGGIEKSGVWLFGKHIADYIHNNDVIVFDEATINAWPTVTTADRLNGLLRSFDRPSAWYRHKGGLYYRSLEV